MWLLRKPICDWLGYSFLGFSFYLLFNHKQPSKSFMIQSIFLLINLPKPLNIKPYSRTFKYLIKNPYLAGTACVHQNDYSLTLYFPQEPYSPKLFPVIIRNSSLSKKRLCRNPRPSRSSSGNSQQKSLYAFNKRQI